jgi:pyrroline-5-carboxylate reductase
MTEKRPTLCIIGAGAIGEAIATGLVSAGWPVSAITLVARRDTRAETASARTGCRCVLDPSEAIPGREVVLVAVKPKDVVALLGRIAGTIDAGQVVVSVAAGVPIDTYEAALGNTPVLRAMPNLPARVGESITCYAAGKHAGRAAAEALETIFRALGATIRLDEPLLDAVTAVSGTGPAYVFLLAEALTESAIREGLPRDVAERLVHKTMKGAGRLLTETNLGPAELRALVTSPGGTTAAAVHVLEERGFRALVEDAVRAASERSRELGRRNPDPSA